jgi:hypothetical protein
VKTINKNHKGLNVKCTDGVTRQFSLTMPLFHTPKPLRSTAVSLWAAGLVNEAQSTYFNGIYADERVAKKEFHFGHEQERKTKDRVLVPREQNLKAHAVVMEPSPTSFVRSKGQVDSTAGQLDSTAAEGQPDKLTAETI